MKPTVVVYTFTACRVTYWRSSLAKAIEEARHGIMVQQANPYIENHDTPWPPMEIDAVTFDAARLRQARYLARVLNGDEGLRETVMVLVLDSHGNVRVLTKQEYDNLFGEIGPMESPS